MIQFSGFTLMALDQKPRLGIRKKVKERATTGKCLHCSKRAVKRGLCDYHYNDFRNRKNSKSEETRTMWEARQIREGKILGTGEIRKLHADSPFGV